MELTNPITNPLRKAKPSRFQTDEAPVAATENVAVTPAPEAVAVVEQSPKATKPVTAAKAVANKEATVATNDPELLRALALLAEKGIALAEPKTRYIKHSYEVEESLHKTFHEMYSILGFKSVKTAINDALSRWCNENKAEFERRAGN
jgi:hypothetical protein